jgi:hypothetical protein
VVTAASREASDLESPRPRAVDGCGQASLPVGCSIAQPALDALEPRGLVRAPLFAGQQWFTLTRVAERGPALTGCLADLGGVVAGSHDQITIMVSLWLREPLVGVAGVGRGGAGNGLPDPQGDGERVAIRADPNVTAAEDSGCLTH